MDDGDRTSWMGWIRVLFFCMEMNEEKGKERWMEKFYDRSLIVF